jgi:hypothetical protein
MNARGEYGKRSANGAWPTVGADQPVELRDVGAGAGIWLGFFAFIGWSIGRGLDAGIEKGIAEFRKPKRP